jgi:prevent-host-death family protein
MRSVGIRELKQDASRIVREVADRGEEVSVTVRGKVVALLVPAAPKRSRTSRSTWADLDRVAREVGRRWPKGQSAARAVREGRR